MDFYRVIHTLAAVGFSVGGDTVPPLPPIRDILMMWGWEGVQPLKNISLCRKNVYYLESLQNMPQGSQATICVLF